MKTIFGVIFALFILFFSTALSAQVWTVAIDPGHGGKDPGAIGRNLKIYEKNVTLAIANELKILLDRDPNFRAVLTRNGDYYISVSQRSDIARRFKANFLISIHADSSVSSKLRGASVWVLSNRRANSEMGRWLEDHEKQSELLGGAGSVLSSHNEKYLDQTVLDLQFGHSQRVGYELGKIILKHFSKITTLSRSVPQHASLGVLRSPDIPSVLVETGFLSNRNEEKKLATKAYRKKIARMIYNGLVEYRKRYYKPTPKHTSSAASQYTEKQHRSFITHKVKSGETLFGLARKYKLPPREIIDFNGLKKTQLFIGQSLKIPLSKTNGTTSKKTVNQAVKHQEKESLPKYHKVKKDQTLYRISREYGVPVKQLMKLNPSLKNGKVLTGQMIRLR